MVLEIATGLTPLAMTVVVVTWSPFAGGAVVVLQCTAERHRGRSLHWDIGQHNTVGRAASPPPIMLDDLYPKQKDQLPITMSLRGRQAVAISAAAVGCAEM